MRLTRWDQVLTTEETNEILRELALWHLSQTKSAEEQRELIATSIASGDFLTLCDTDLAYGQLTAHDAYHLRQALAFYSKRGDLVLDGIDRTQVAVDKFLSAEALCQETNHIFKSWSSGNFQFSPRVDSVLYRAQRKIANLLGDVPSLEELRLAFGPGATTQVKKREASPRRKLGERFACSEELLGTVSSVLEECQGWLPETDADSAQVDVVIHHGRLEFVPKNAKTDRAIVVEPMLNSMCQLGIGDFIARRLRTVGIDIRDQSRNQRLAQEGSLTGALATLDLSSASDTIAIELVAHLLPYDWFDFLSRFRTGTIKHEGTRYKLHKFSSMGNGFTFPLETLIFWALSSSCVPKERQAEVSVYGDDIIVPTESYALTCEVLRACGFIPNPSKSFGDGPFRESCGKDYLSGVDIRPCYIKGSLSGENVFVLHNYYVRTWQPEPASLLLRFIDPSLQLWGPDGYGDGHLIGDWQPKPHKRKDGWVGYLFDTYTWKSRRSFATSPGDRVLPSYSIYASPPQAGVPDVWALQTGELVVDRFSAKHGRHFGFHNSIPSGYMHDRKGRLGVVLPGRKGYKRISIYTLTPG